MILGPLYNPQEGGMKGFIFHLACSNILPKVSPNICVLFSDQTRDFIFTTQRLHIEISFSCPSVGWDGVEIGRNGSQDIGCVHTTSGGPGNTGRGTQLEGVRMTQKSRHSNFYSPSSDRPRPGATN